MGVFRKGGKLRKALAAALLAALAAVLGELSGVPVVETVEEVVP